MSETERLRRRWDKHARGYDKQIGWSGGRFFPNTRHWICTRATGDVLELAIGTGLNLPHYPDDIRLTGIDLSPAMLAIAADRARHLHRDVDLRTGDAERLPFRDNSFDTV